MTDDGGQEDEQLAPWYAALAGDLGLLAHELADEPTAAMREVLAAEDAEGARRLPALSAPAGVL